MISLGDDGSGEIDYPDFVDFMMHSIQPVVPLTKDGKGKR